MLWNERMHANRLVAKSTWMMWPPTTPRYCSVVVARIVPAFAVAFSTIVLSPFAVISGQLEIV